MASPIPRFQTIGVNEGLSQSLVTALYQDKQGFMWIGTGDGLNRYDGVNLSIYRVPMPKGKRPTSIVRGRLCEDDKGNIWFSNEFGLHCWEAQQQQIVTRLGPAPGQRFFDFTLILMSRGALWAYNCDKGILRYDLHNGATQLYPLPDSFKESGQRSCLDPQVGPNNHIWFKRTQGGAFYYFDTRTARFGTGLAPAPFHFVGVGKGKHYWASSDSLVVYDSASGNSSSLALPYPWQGSGAKRLAEDRWGRVWVATASSGLYAYYPAEQRVHHYRHSNIRPGTLPIDITTVLFIDRADNLWVGTDGGGVSRLDLKPQRFRLFPLDEGDYPVLKDYFVKCFYEDEKNKTWFGTHSNGLSILDRHSGKLENYSTYGAANKPLKVVSALEPDPDGKIWIAHALAFSIFDPGSGRFEDVPVSEMPALDAGYSYGIGLVRLQDGRMLGATRSGLVLFSKKNGRWKGRSFLRHPLLGTFTTVVCQMADGTIWAASNQAGLLRLEPEADSLRVAGQYFEGTQIRGLHPDERQPEILWVGTTNGFAQFHTRTGAYEFKGLEDGMSNAYVYGLLEDAQHNLWLTTNGGLIYYDRNDQKFTTYTYADGLQSNEFNSGAYYKGRSGTLYFGGIRGFNWIEPETMPAGIAQPPPVALSDFVVNGRKTTLRQSAALTLAHDQNDIAFRVAVLDYSRPEANKIAYYLKGWDHKWIESRSHEAHYANLPPGRYELYIRGCNAAGIWSPEKVFVFTIRAPFYQTTLFYVLVAVAVLALLLLGVYGLVRRKLQAQRRIIAQQQLLMEERTRISKDMHDEIGSGLTRIAMMSETLGALKAAPADTQKIAIAARTLLQNMGEIIWALNPSNDSLESLLAYLREQLHLFMEPFSVAYVIDFPEEAPFIELTNAQRRNIYLTAKEAVNNALKHAKPTAIHIAAKIDKGSLQFEICDDGCGFDESQVRQSANGLRNMRRRLKDIGGYFHCDSQMHGTRISFGMPLRKGPTLRYMRRITTFITSAQKSRRDTFEV